MVEWEEFAARVKRHKSQYPLGEHTDIWWLNLEDYLRTKESTDRLKFLHPVFKDYIAYRKIGERHAVK